VEPCKHKQKSGTAEKQEHEAGLLEFDVFGWVFRSSGDFRSPEILCRSLETHIEGVLGILPPVGLHEGYAVEMPGFHTAGAERLTLSVAQNGLDLLIGHSAPDLVTGEMA
jgi:hypothetical protein